MTDTTTTTVATETVTPAAKTATEYLGLTKKMGQDKAEGKNMIFRLIRIDGESYFSWPEDTRTDRVCVEIDNGKITKAVIQ